MITSVAGTKAGVPKPEPPYDAAARPAVGVLDLGLARAIALPLNDDALVDCEKSNGALSNSEANLRSLNKLREELTAELLPQMLVTRVRRPNRLNASIKALGERTFLHFGS